MAERTCPHCGWTLALTKDGRCVNCGRDPQRPKNAPENEGQTSIFDSIDHRDFEDR